jgi:hypothetical protein
MNKKEVLDSSSSSSSRSESRSPSKPKKRSDKDKDKKKSKKSDSRKDRKRKSRKQASSSRSSSASSRSVSKSPSKDRKRNKDRKHRPKTRRSRSRSRSKEKEMIKRKFEEEPPKVQAPPPKPVPQKTEEELRQERERKMQERLAKARALKFEASDNINDASAPTKEELKQNEIKETPKEVRANLLDELELDDEEELRNTAKAKTMHPPVPQNSSNGMYQRNGLPSQKSLITQLIHKPKKDPMEEEDSLDAFMNSIQKQAAPQMAFDLSHFYPKPEGGQKEVMQEEHMSVDMSKVVTLDDLVQLHRGIKQETHGEEMEEEVDRYNSTTDNQNKQEDEEDEEFHKAFLRAMKNGGSGDHNDETGEKKCSG